MEVESIEILEVAIKEELEKQARKLNPKKIGITQQRLSTIFARNGQNAEKFELRMLQTFLGIYVYEFEERFGLKINEE